MSKKEETIFNGCGVDAQDSLCTNLQDTACPNRSDDGMTCTDCICDCEDTRAAGAEKEQEWEDSMGQAYGDRLQTTLEIIGMITKPHVPLAERLEKLKPGETIDGFKHGGTITMGNSIE